MKKIVFVLAFVFSKILFGQTSFDYLQKGLTKQKQNNLKGAIKDYNTAIRKDRSNMVAYYNRGYCEFLLKKYKSSFYDLKKVTELDPNFVRAYVLRAKIYSHFNEDSAALPDLDKAIELNPTFPHVLTLRGKIRVATGNQQGACEDFNRAKLIDDKEADQLLFLYCTNGKPTPAIGAGQRHDPNAKVAW